MIMFFLWDKNNSCPWHLPHDTVNTSARATELGTLLKYLDVKGITFGTPFLPVPLEPYMIKIINELVDGQRVLVEKTHVDKKTGKKTGHAMSGVAERVQPPEPNKQPYNKIHVFNQSKQWTLVCLIKTNKTDGQSKLISETGKTVITWFLPLTIA